MPGPADVLSDSDISKAYEDVRSDKSDTKWLILKYSAASGDNLELAKTGEGDIAEMCENLGDDEAAYAYIRMTLGNDEYSERTKFVFISWAGSGVKVMRRAKMSFQGGQVKQAIRTYAVEIQTGDKRDLAADTVTMQLRRAMGANYDRQSTAY